MDWTTAGSRLDMAIDCGLLISVIWHALVWQSWSQSTFDGVVGRMFRHKETEEKRDPKLFLSTRSSLNCPILILLLSDSHSLYLILLSLNWVYSAFCSIMNMLLMSGKNLLLHNAVFLLFETLLTSLSGKQRALQNDP